ncbi:MAG: hypothetical protein LBI64_08370 [Coriobacteriales bacterium]|jgi:hypothetical protein|nr:hypothetical protein [Coriobacteriales bacterium]
MIDETVHQLSQDLAVVDPSEDNYDPLADISPEEQGLDDSLEAIGYIGNPGKLASKSEVPPALEKSPREKIDALFSNMLPFKRYLLSIMEFCREPRDFVQLDDFVSELQAKRRTIYSTVEFCLMLEDVGALSEITEDGAPYDETRAEPVEVERDGQVFLEPGDPPPLFWQITEAGSQVLKEDDPLKALQKIFEDEAPYKSVFLQILELCGQNGGVSINEIKEKANTNPVLERPRKTVQFFLDYLDRNNAVIWDDNWKISSVGKQALELLRTEVEAEAEAETPVHPKAQAEGETR